MTENECQYPNEMMRLKHAAQKTGQAIKPAPISKDLGVL
jgi:hypothetical protein